MPRDGSFPDLSSEALAKGEMTLEEKALRHALAFFSDESKWHRGWEAHGPNGSMCVGQAILGGPNCIFSNSWPWANEVCGRKNIFGMLVTAAKWNETCSSFATMTAHLRKRIKHYEDQRMKVAA